MLLSIVPNRSSSYSFTFHPGLTSMCWHINDQIKRCWYWHNGKRYDLGKGELTDITVNEVVT